MNHFRCIAIFILLCGIFFSAKGQQRAQVVSAMINGCGAVGVSDGANENMVVYTGNAAMTNVVAGDIDIRFGNTNPATFTITSTYTTDATLISDMNALLPGTCDFSFVGVTLGSTDIPAGSHILVLNDDITTTVDYDAWCGSGLGNSDDEIFVMISSDGTWDAGGTFPNTTASDRFITSRITNDDGLTVVTNAYNDQWASDADGNYARWNDNGGDAAIYSNYPSCTPTNADALPVTLIAFGAQQQQNTVKVNWTTAEELGNSHSNVYRSRDAITWEEIGIVGGQGTTSEIQYYEFTDRSPYSGRSYYRLKQNDFNGDSETFEAISVRFDRLQSTLEMYPNPSSDFITIDTSDPLDFIRIIGSHGSVYELPPAPNSNSVNKIFDIRDLPHGVYTVVIPGEGIRTRKKLLKQ